MKDLDKAFGKKKELTLTKGVVHEFFGLTIDHSLPGKVVFSMFEQIDNIIVEVPDDMKLGQKHGTLARRKLFITNKGLPLLYITRAALFNRILVNSHK